MPTPQVPWVRVQATRGLEWAGLDATPSPLEMAAGAALELPDLGQFATPRDKARFLLHTAAEIEHALLVQYLYAAYSLKEPSAADGVTDAQQQQAIRAWRRTLVNIAVQEMTHLMTVQNLLLCTRLPLNFEREDFPPQKDFYPFQLHLEPLTQVSLAKYVVAESPTDAESIADIVAQAGAAAGQQINRVGVLYGLMGVLFSSHEGLYQNAAGGDPWFVMVRELAHLLFTQFPHQLPETWHLPDDAFDGASLARQADDSWAFGSGVRIFTAQTRDDCLKALRDIGVQGEGLTIASADGQAAEAEQSHFERFLKMYRGEPGRLPVPAAGEWVPTRDVPTNPKVVAAGQAGPNDITAPLAVAWATVADLRYQLLLGMLEQYFYQDPAQRDWIRDWCVWSAMPSLRDLARKLTELDRGAGGRAAIPFTLPAVLQLPEDPAQRRELHLRRIDDSLQAVQALLLQQPGDELLQEIQQSDEDLKANLLGQAPPPPPDAEAAMRDLLEQKRGIAKVMHKFIAVGATNLSQLFKDRNDDAILDFLRTGTATRDPVAGRKLIEPGKPNESALYLQMTVPGGVMEGVFSEEELTVVRNWIVSMSPAAPPPPPAPPNAGEEMIALLRLKRPQGRIMHMAVEVDGGTTLSQLFEAENYDGVLQFLQNGVAALEPFAGQRLVAPGSPQQSAFYRHISEPKGVMSGRFTPEQIAVVERWIRSLSPPADAAPPIAGLEAAAPQAAGLQAAGVQAAGLQASEVRLSLTSVAEGLSSPVFVTAPPGDTARLFVVEQRGAIRIVNLADNTLLPTPFLKVENIVTGGERGLLGLAFHPNYAANGQFYVNCTNSQGHTEIRRYAVSAADPNVADPNSRQLVLLVEQPFANHNGGWIAFGPRDGFLYVALGDGGSANDPQNRAQNLNVLLGKMLRIDVDRDDFPTDPARNYAIPADNPFVGQSNTRPEIWAYGLRNPWRCSFDHGTGDLFIGDVGQNEREEINRQPAASHGGENYGWRLKEGTRLTGLGSIGGQTLIDPIHEYSHTEGLAVVGGYVHRGPSPQFAGLYVFGDFTGRVWSFRLVDGQVREVQERTDELLEGGASLDGLSSFGEDQNGELYLTTLEGAVWRLEAVPAPAGAGRWDDVARVRIHPAIGVARVGNAGFVNGQPQVPADPADYFPGPERPFETAAPAGGYKRDGRVRRQAARFRLFAYDSQDRLIGELTAEHADITWTVELANTKASWKEFRGPSPNGPVRNAHVTGADRAKLDIRPGARTVRGPQQAAVFDGGSFSDFHNGQIRTVSNLCLGQIQTDEAGRLLVLAGEGKAESPWNKPILDFANNRGWCDTTADGPVNATVRLRNSDREAPVLGAWVICTPPKFAPAMRNVITLYDTLLQRAIDEGRHTPPATPSFKYDIYPILERPMAVKWLMESPGSIHDRLAIAFPPAAQNRRNDVFKRLRHPQKGAGLNRAGMNMPILFDDNNDWEASGDAGLAVTKAMYETLQKWRDGAFTNDWDGSPPQPLAELTPEGLDRAALENCAGAAFFPGIEASWMLRDVFPIVPGALFRLDQANLRAGDVTKQMAIPWQADFFKCTSGGSLIGWWPQQRPDEVFTAGGNQQVSWTRDKVNSHLQMVERWHELGFVVFDGSRYVETERNADVPAPVV